MDDDFQESIAAKSLRELREMRHRWALNAAQLALVDDEIERREGEPVLTLAIVGEPENCEHELDPRDCDECREAYRASEMAWQAFDRARGH